MSFGACWTDRELAPRSSRSGPGHSRALGLLLGGVSTAMLRRTLLSAARTRRPGNRFPSGILVGVDGSDHSLAAAAVARSIADRFGSELVVVAKGWDAGRPRAHSGTFVRSSPIPASRLKCSSISLRGGRPARCRKPRPARPGGDRKRQRAGCPPCGVLDSGRPPAGSGVLTFVSPFPFDQDGRPACPEPPTHSRRSAPARAVPRASTLRRRALLRATLHTPGSGGEGAHALGQRLRLSHAVQFPAGARPAIRDSPKTEPARTPMALRHRPGTLHGKTTGRSL